MRHTVQNYTTYRNYYKLAKSVPDNPEMPTSPAMKAARRFEELHPYNLQEKAHRLREEYRFDEYRKLSRELEDAWSEGRVKTS